MRALSFEFPRKSLIFLRTYLFPKNLLDRLIFGPSRSHKNVNKSGFGTAEHGIFWEPDPESHATLVSKAMSNFVNF